MTDIVIGSGPAGISAAWALLKQGRQVMMLDVGYSLEKDKEQLKSKLASLPPHQWHSTDIEQFTYKKQNQDIEGILPFGSGFLFRTPDNLFQHAHNNNVHIGLRPSFAKGGLSNGWGSAILPYRKQDINDWPKATTNLTEHYQALREFMPMAGKDDDISQLFPMMHFSKDTSLPLTSQATELLSRLNQKKAALNHDGIFFGQGRQAAEKTQCQQCNMCLYGCPYGAIYCASDTLETLKKQPNFNYHQGLLVTHFKEQENSVSVQTINIADGKKRSFKGSRLYIGCGVLPTAKLVLQSLGLYRRSITLKDSQHFFLPLLHSWKPHRNIATEPKNTLVQLFIEIIGAEPGSRTSHAQLYTFNNLYAVDMQKRFGWSAQLMRPLIKLLSERLIVAQGFLHSDDSASMELQLIQNGDGSDHLEISPRPNPETNHKVTLLREKLAGVAMRTGLLPLTPLSRLGPIGSSFHCGATFPMQDQPTKLASDVLGRPAGLKRVHIIDASVFPSIPATTITLSVMANAHRIATEGSKLSN